MVGTKRGGKCLFFFFYLCSSLHTNTHPHTHPIICDPLFSFCSVISSEQRVHRCQSSHRVGCSLFWLLSCFSIRPTEKDDDYIVLCHHWDRWVLLSLQLLLIKQVKHLHQPLTHSVLFFHCWSNAFFFLFFPSLSSVFQERQLQEKENFLRCSPVLTLTITRICFIIYLKKNI